MAANYSAEFVHMAAPEIQPANNGYPGKEQCGTGGEDCHNCVSIEHRTRDSRRSQADSRAQKPGQSKLVTGGDMKYFEDFTAGEIAVTRARTITETDIVNFAALTGDWYPLHTDIEYAKKGPFGERIAHGLLILSIANGLMPLYDMAIVAFYGMDKVRFTAPTKIGDTIHVELEVVEKQDKGDIGGVITLKEYVKNQRGENVALSTKKVLIAKRPSS